MAFDYGLELTNNSKVGWAFSMARSQTCIGATSLCKRLCYGNGIRYQSKGQQEKRSRNFRTVEFLLESGGPELLAENLVMLVDQARPRDWLTARVSGIEPCVPWTLRIHDVGDFHSVPYVQAWLRVVLARPNCSFWFYTRSFLYAPVFAALCELAALPNCQGWLSVDSENFEMAILSKCSAVEAGWKLALLQDRSLGGDVVSAVKSSASSSEVVNFPYHRAGYHDAALDDRALVSCPSVTGSLKLQSGVGARPCQRCTYCLPGTSVMVY